MADLSQTAANVHTNSGASTSSGEAGEAITAGEPVYIDTTDSNKIKKCDANVAASAACAGIAVNDAASGQPVTYCTAGSMDLGATLTVSETYILSATAGAIAPVGDMASGMYATNLGIASAADTFIVDINNSQVLKP